MVMPRRHLGMSITILAASHLDHGLTEAQISYLVQVFAFSDRDGFFIETLELPEELGTLPCALRGPLRGEPPIKEDSEVFYEKRGNRPYTSRMVAWETTPTRQVTIIAGPHEDYSCVLYTAYGGPLAPKEPGDPTLKPEEREASERFWSEHALATGVRAENDRSSPAAQS